MLVNLNELIYVVHPASPTTFSEQRGGFRAVPAKARDFRQLQCGYSRTTRSREPMFAILHKEATIAAEDDADRRKANSLSHQTSEPRSLVQRGRAQVLRPTARQRQQRALAMHGLWQMTVIDRHFLNRSALLFSCAIVARTFAPGGEGREDEKQVYRRIADDDKNDGPDAV